jgi:hypothetical protein
MVRSRGISIGNKCGIVSINPAVLNGLTTWVAINTMAMSYALFKRPFTLPHVKDVLNPLDILKTLINDR